MTPVDDLKPKDWVAVTKLDRPEPEGGGYGYFGDMFGGRPKRPVTYEGQPLEIQAISLPFISVCDGKQVFAIDVRETQVQRLSRQYVQAMTRPVQQVCSDQQRKRRRKRAEKPSGVYCAHCGCGKFREIGVANGSNLVWQRVCSRCGSAGDMVVNEQRS
jgi:hypothetical protein